MSLVKRTIGVAASVAVAFATFVAPAQAAPAGCSGDLKLIFQGGLTGPAAQTGIGEYNGFKLAVLQYNEKRGSGPKVEPGFIDTQADPAQTPPLALATVNDPCVIGVVGGMYSGETRAALPIYLKGGLPVISPSATNPKYTRQGFKTAFRLVADDVHLGGVLGRYAVNELKGKTIAVIDDRTAYGQGVAEEFEKAVKAAGGNVVAHEFTTDKATDFMPILTTLKGKKPDIIFFGGMDAVGGPMLKQMKSLGIKSKYMGGDGICTTELVKLAGDAMADGQVVCAEAGGVDGALKKGMDDFGVKFKKRFNDDVKLYSPYVYDAVFVMVDAMQRAKSTEPAKYLPELAKTTGYKGVTGTISFDAKGDIKNGALTLYTFKAGKRDQIAVVR